MRSQNEAELDSSHRSMVDASLILTVLNEGETIQAFFRDLLAQSHVPRQVVVIDGGSRDNTMRLLNNVKVNAPFEMIVKQSVGATISAGRNEAATLANQEILLISDGGSRLDPGWVRSLCQAIDAGADVASGFYRPLPGNFWQTTIGYVITPLEDEIVPHKFLPSSRSVAIRKPAFDSVGGYPEWLDYCEDLVLDIAMKDSGLTFSYVPSAIVAWNARASISAFAKQYYRYARGDGKAGLWTRRHALRYLAYTVGLLSISARGRSRIPIIACGVGASAYFWRFFRRVRRREFPTSVQKLLTLAAVPVVVVIGDISKMIGYPVGIAWRVERDLLDASVQRSRSRAKGDR